MELILNTNGDCFLCLQTVPKTEEQEISLRNICRFLQINTSVVLLEGLKEEHKDASNLFQDKNYNFSVTLCNPCYAATGKLSSLIHDLEVISLQVNYYSEVFQTILEKTDDLTSTTTKTTGYSVTSAETRVVNHIRKNIKQKCCTHNKKKKLSSTKLPLVRIKRLKRNSMTRVNNSCQPSFDLPLIAENENETDPNMTRKCHSLTEANLRKIPENILTEYCEEQGFSDNYNCVFCEEIIKSKQSFKNHLTSKHSEKLLSFAKRSEVSEETFAKLCRQVVQMESEKCQVMLSTPKSDGGVLFQKGRLHYNCYKCQKTITDKRYLTNHFVMEHADVLAQLLNGLQKDEKYCKSYTIANIQVNPTSFGVCDNKESKLVSANHSSLSRPTVAVVESVDQGDVSSRFSTEAISNRLNTATIMVKTIESTTNYYQPGSENKVKKRKTKGGEGIDKGLQRTGTEKKKPDQLVCPYCENSFSRIDALRLHMLHHHPEQFFLPYKPFQQSTSEFADSCRKIFQSETEEYTDKKKSAVTRQCAYCTSNHLYRTDYLYHLVYHHKKILVEKIEALVDKDQPANVSYPVVEEKEEEGDWICWPTEESEEYIDWTDIEDVEGGTEDSDKNSKDHIPVLVEAISIEESDNFT